MKKLLFIANDVIGDRTAGPGIRYIELGKEMARRGYPVTVLGKNPEFRSPQPFACARLSAVNMIRHLRRCDCVIVRGGGPLTTLLVMLFGHGKDVIADLYSFTQFEVPHTIAHDRRAWIVNEVRKAFHAHKLRFYSRYLRKFWVANERQRDFLVGLLTRAGNRDSIERLWTVPFGCPGTPPVKHRAVLKGVVPGIGKDDFVLLWGGGVWDWLDPLTLVRAMARIRPADGGIKLYFMGVQAPSGYLPENAVRLMDLARNLGVLDETVFVHRDWVPYHERTDYLLEADAGVSLHPASQETHYSFRTRNLDYLYCGLPMIHTDGDVWAERIGSTGMGIVVPPGDDQRVAEAILAVRRDPSLRERMRAATREQVAEFSWENISRSAARSIESPVPRSGQFLRKAVDVAAGYAAFAMQSLLTAARTLFREQAGPQNRPIGRKR